MGALSRKGEAKASPLFLPYAKSWLTKSADSLTILEKPVLRLTWPYQTWLIKTLQKLTMFLVLTNRFNSVSPES